MALEKREQSKIDIANIPEIDAMDVLDQVTEFSFKEEGGLATIRRPSSRGGQGDFVTETNIAYPDIRWQNLLTSASQTRYEPTEAELEFKSELLQKAEDLGITKVSQKALSKKQLVNLFHKLQEGARDDNKEDKKLLYGMLPNAPGGITPLAPMFSKGAIERAGYTSTAEQIRERYDNIFMGRAIPSDTATKQAQKINHALNEQLLVRKLGQDTWDKLPNNIKIPLLDQTFQVGFDTKHITNKEGKVIKSGWPKLTAALGQYDPEDPESVTPILREMGNAKVLDQTRDRTLKRISMAAEAAPEDVRKRVKRMRVRRQFQSLPTPNEYFQKRMEAQPGEEVDSRMLAGGFPSAGEMGAAFNQINRPITGTESEAIQGPPTPMPLQPQEEQGPQPTPVPQQQADIPNPVLVAGETQGLNMPEGSIPTISDVTEGMVLDANMVEEISEGDVLDASMLEEEAPQQDQSVAGQAEAMMSQGPIASLWPTGENQVGSGTIEDPIRESPLTIEQRGWGKGYGNPKGFMKALKRDFEGVVPTDEHGILVQKGGKWHTADPGLMDILRSNDPWKISKEIAKDVADHLGVGLSAITGSGGAILGSAFGPGGTFLGLAGGTYFGALMARRLGRYKGTYIAPPKEELVETTMETAMALAGQSLAIGAKPTAKHLMKTMKKIGDSAILEPVSAVLGYLSGTGAGAFQYMAKNAPKVMKVTKAAAKGVSTTKEAAAVLEKRAVQRLEAMLGRASDALPRRYGQILDDIFDVADQRKISINFKGITDDIYKQLDELGFGKIVTKKGSKIDSFRPFSPEEIAERAQASKTAVQFGDNRAPLALKRLVNSLQSYKNMGTLSGRNAAQRINDLNRVMNEVTNSVFEQTKSKAAKRHVEQITSFIRQQIGKEFEKVGLGGKYAQLSKLYSRYSNAVNSADKVLRTESADKLLEQLTKDQVRGKVVGEAKLLAELAPGGDKLLDQAFTYHTAARFLPIMPKFGIVQSLIAGGGVGALTTGSLSVGTAGALGQMSPRLLRNELRMFSAMNRYASKQLNYLRAYDPERLLNEPEIFQGAVRATMQGAQKEGQMTKQLVEEPLKALNGQ